MAKAIPSTSWVAHGLRAWEALPLHSSRLELPTRGRVAAIEALPASEKDGNRLGRTDAANEFGARVRTAHGDGWQVEGWARQVHGGGAQVVRGPRLMASGLPTPRNIAHCARRPGSQ